MPFVLRDASLTDIADITAIYRESVLNGVASYEVDPPTLDQMATRFTAITGKGYPYIVAVEQTVPEIVALPDRTRRLGPGETIDLGALQVATIGGQHAVIHRDYPRIGNVGFVFRSQGEPSVLHPGDSLDAVAEGIDIALIPAFGPWAATRETIDFARAVAAPRGFLIHDGLLNERGLGLIDKHVSALSSTQLIDVRDTRPWAV